MIRAAITIALVSLALTAPVLAEQPREPTPIDHSADACGLWESESDFTSFLYELKLEDGQRVPMRMPSAYFCGGERRDGLTHRAQLFWVRISDFTPLSCGRSEQSAGPDGLSLLLSDHVPQPDKLRNSFGRNYGAPPKAYQSAPWQYDLVRYFDYTRQSQRDVYSSDDTESPRVVIRCHPEVAGMRSFCKMLFEVEKVDLTIGIARSELPNWREIEARARRLISCGLDLGEQD